jgi:hypothetical protein
MRECPLCKKVHALFINAGARVLFLSDWEQCCDEQDLTFQLRNQLPLISVPDNLVRFLELANS